MKKKTKKLRIPVTLELDGDDVVGVVASILADSVLCDGNESPEKAQATVRDWWRNQANLLADVRQHVRGDPGMYHQWIEGQEPALWNLAIYLVKLRFPSLARSLTVTEVI